MRSIAANFADWQVAGPIDTSLHTAETLAADYLAKLNYPQHIFDELSPEAQDRVAVAVGCPTRAQWQSPPVEPGTPSYAEPRWDAEIYDVLFKQMPPPPPQPRPVPPRTSAASQWPELSDPTDPDRLSAELADALGAGWSPVPYGGDGLLRVRLDMLDLTFVAVPGGSMSMGATDEELAELSSSEEFAEGVDVVAEQSCPVRIVAVEPFLCAETPLLEQHAEVLSADGDAANSHSVLRQNSWQAAATVSATGLRLLSEAEWEWIARDCGRQSWLCGDDAPEDWTARMVEGDPREARTPRGTLMMGWGEWVDDGWHPNYVGAPPDSSAWEPMDRPATARGGGFACWPWQSGGEAVLHHAACRDCDAGGAIHAVRLAADLPPR